MNPIDWLSFPPLSALRAFEATVRLGGFSAAAKALNVTHAAVAQQVRGLEDFLAVALVQRQGRALAFTPEAERLAAALNSGFGDMQAALAALRSANDLRALTVTVTPLFAKHWLLPRLKDFWQQHPGQALTLLPDERLYDLRRERIDLGIRYGLGQWPGLDSSFLASARLVVVAAKALLAGRPQPTVAQMASLPWVVQQGVREPLDWLKKRGIDISAADKMELPTEELALVAAREGYGLFVAGAALIEQDVADGLLEVIHDSRDDTLGYYIVSAPGPMSPAARTFVSWLKAQA